MKTRRTPRNVAAVAAALSLACTTALAVCPATTVISGLNRPLGAAVSNQGNLIVSETGTATPNSGRISIVDPSGSRRTLLSGLPSGIEFLGAPSGASGAFMRGRTLYVAIGVGDVAVAGPAPGSAIANPNPISSPLFSSILAIHFSAAVEKNTQGFWLTLSDQNALAGGGKVTLSNNAGEKIMVERVADFPNYVPEPTVAVPAAIRFSNPFDLVIVDDSMFVTDGSFNMVRKVDLTTGVQSVVATFPNIANPIFPAVGGPFSEAVPTGIREVDGLLLVTLFRGVPFTPGGSTVVAIDPISGVWAPFIGGLKTAIDVLPMPAGLGAHDYLVLQHASIGLFFGGPGLLLGFDGAGGSKTVVADCLTLPTSLTLDAKTGTLYVTQLDGTIVSIPVAP